MPTYEYVCSACSHRLEVFQTFSEEPLTECEQCGGALRRVFHPVGILFKGSGFYSTDARSKSSSRPNGTTKETDSKKSSDSGSSGSASKEASSGDSATAKPEKSTGSSTEATGS